MEKKGGGYIAFSRSLFDDDLWLAEPFTRGQAWIDLIKLANYEPGYIIKRGIRVDLERGDVGWSEVELAARWKWSRGKVRRFLIDALSGENPKLIRKTVQQNGQQMSFVTICYHVINYDSYLFNRQQNGQQTVQQTDSKRYTKKENNKNNKTNTPPKPPSGGPVVAGDDLETVKTYVNYINAKTGRHFSAKSPKTQKRILERVREGYSFDEIIAVINERLKTDGLCYLNKNHFHPESIFGPENFKRVFSGG